MGELISITLPTGASAVYQYELDSVSSITPYKLLRNSLKRKDLTYLREYDGASAPVTETWLYSIDQETQIGQITAPDGGVSREIFAPFASGQIGGVPNKSEHADGTVVERQWLVNTPHGFPNLSQGSLGNNTYVKTEYTSIRNAAGALSKTAIKTYKHDKNGNVTEVKGRRTARRSRRRGPSPTTHYRDCKVASPPRAGRSTLITTTTAT